MVTLTARQSQFGSPQKTRVPDLLSRTADRWRLGCSTEPWPTIDISYHKSADSPVLAVQRRAKRAYFYRQARSFAFCTSAELARIPRTQVQSSRHVLAGRSKPRRSHHTIPLARAPCRTFARSPPSPHGPSQQAQPELHLRQTSTVPSPHGPSLSPQPSPAARATSAEVSSYVESRRFELFLPSAAREAHLFWQTHKPVRRCPQYHQRLFDSPYGDDAHAS
jgi:hypothetical protein